MKICFGDEISPMYDCSHGPSPVLSSRVESRARIVLWSSAQRWSSSSDVMSMVHGGWGVAASWVEPPEHDVNGATVLSVKIGSRARIILWGLGRHVGVRRKIHQPHHH